MKREVMQHVVEEVETLLKDEQTECVNWLDNTRGIYLGTPEWSDREVQRMEMECVYGLERTTHALDWLKEGRVIGEYTLNLIKNNIEDLEEMLGGASSVMDYAVVGMLRAWIFEFENCGTYSIQFDMYGNWQGSDEDLTLCDGEEE